MSTFNVGVGQWRGSAEVYDAAGVYLGPGVDRRTVTPIEDGVVEVDVSFEGPFSFAGTYRIVDVPGGRAYEGPLNHGFAEAIGSHLVDTNNYWPSLGLSQRLSLMVDPAGDRQLSLALLSRGEQLRYAVVGENVRIEADEVPSFVAIGSLLDRFGTWSGTLATTDGSLVAGAGLAVIETVDGPTTTTIGLAVGGVALEMAVTLASDGPTAWTAAGDVVGSWSIYGGRARVGTFVHTTARLRVNVREVVAADGSRKAVVQQWFRGGRRVAVIHGFLEFAATP